MRIVYFLTRPAVSFVSSKKLIKRRARKNLVRYRSQQLNYVKRRIHIKGERWPNYGSFKTKKPIRFVRRLGDYIKSNFEYCHVQSCATFLLKPLEFEQHSFRQEMEFTFYNERILD